MIFNDNDDNYDDNSPWQGISRGLHWPSHSLLTFFIIYYDDDDQLQCNDNYYDNDDYYDGDDCDDGDDDGHTCLPASPRGRQVETLRQ